MNRQEMSNRIADRTEPWDMLVIGSGAIGVGIARIRCCTSGKDKSREVCHSLSGSRPGGQGRYPYNGIVNEDLRHGDPVRLYLAHGFANALKIRLDVHKTSFRLTVYYLPLSAGRSIFTCSGQRFLDPSDEFLLMA